MTTTTLLYVLTGIFVVSNLAIGLWFMTMSGEKAAAMAAKSGRPVDRRSYRTMGFAILVSTPIIAGVLVYAALSGMVG